MASQSMQLGDSASTNLFTSFIKSQFLTKPRRLPENVDLSGQVAIVTGGSSGLGYHCVRHLLTLKLSHVILAVRSLDKGNSVAANLRLDFPAAKIEVWYLEMNSYESIQAFCRQVERDLQRLDITILNAGIVNAEFRKCSTGHEEVIQTKSPTGKPGRLTIVSSGVALWAKLPNRNERPLLTSFDNTELLPYDGVERYFSSKMLGHLFFVRMLPYLNPDEVIVNLVEPGMCKGSELHREATGIAGAFLSSYKAMTGRRPEDGAWTYVDAAVVKGKESHGCFCMDWKIHPFTQLVYLPEGKPIMGALWEETMTEFEFAGAADILAKDKKVNNV